MSLRETINKNPMIVVAAIVVVIGLGGYFAFNSMRPEQVRVPTHAYFTIDDGKTRFLDDRNLLPPFTRDGKEAVGVAVFTCDGGKTEIIGYLQKFTPEYKAKRDAALKELADAKAKLPIGATSQSAFAVGPPPGGPPALSTLIKKIGGTEWVRMISPEGIKIQQSIVCPSGSGHGPEPVDP